LPSSLVLSLGFLLITLNYNPFLILLASAIIIYKVPQQEKELLLTNHPKKVKVKKLKIPKKLLKII
jgi:hypothetical protein